VQRAQPLDVPLRLPRGGLGLARARAGHLAGLPHEHLALPDRLAHGDEHRRDLVLAARADDRLADAADVAAVFPPDLEAARDSRGRR
jgi:hypothetical protein